MFYEVKVPGIPLESVDKWVSCHQFLCGRPWSDRLKFWTEKVYDIHTVNWKGTESKEQTFYFYKVSWKRCVNNIPNSSITNILRIYKVFYLGGYIDVTSLIKFV